MRNVLLFATVAVLLVAAAAIALLRRRSEPVPPAPEPVATASYRCDEGKSIDAALFAGAGAPRAAPGNRPAPGGSARVVLSDGRTVTLRQTISADGVRYSDGDPSIEGDESFVFWSKGNGALVLEHNGVPTYTGCIRVADDPGGLPQDFASGALRFSIRFPAGWTADTTYRYTALGPGRDIAGVSFTVPASLAGGTNLSEGSYLSVERIPGAERCAADLFLSEGAAVSDTTIDGVTRSVAHRVDAAVGNRYEETVFAIPGTSPCIAVRYFIHWTIIENYPPGAVTAFDRQALIDRFDAMRETLILLQ